MLPTRCRLFRNLPFSVQTELSFFTNRVLKLKYQPGCTEATVARSTFCRAFCCFLAVNDVTFPVHTVKACRGSGGTSPPILNLVVSITVPPYTPDTERALSARRIEGWTEPTGILDVSENLLNPWPLPGFQPLIFKPVTKSLTINALQRPRPMTKCEVRSHDTCLVSVFIRLLYGAVSNCEVVLGSFTDRDI